tara:strand:- start:672 stop:878 length:207 start_codon:yes stop_codon:yes gene_type:complete
MINNIKHIKTTILGLFFMASGCVYWYTSDLVDFIVLGAFYGTGVLLFLSPDTLIELLKNFLKFKKTKQ